MSLIDSRGMPLSSTNAASVARYEKTLDLMHSYFMDPMAELDALIKQDPDFLMAYCMRAALGITAGDNAMKPLLRDSVEAGEARHALANNRERRHLAAARAWLDGDFVLSLRRYGEILSDYPRDSLALQVAHICDFLLGQSTMLRDRVAGVLPYWGATTPGYGYVLGMHAFGLEESGEYARAEERGRRALELNPRDPWAVHAVAHVMEMQGRHAEGIDWLASRKDDWSENNAFAIHNWWHLALYYLDLGEHKRVLELYDKKVRGQPSIFALDMVDASALLWRMHLRGADVGNRWQELASAWEQTVSDGFYAFNDAHAMMAFIGAGRFDLVSQLLATLERRARGTGTNAAMTRDVGLPLCQALEDFAAGRYGATVEMLTTIRTIAHRFGGSNAQRDIIHLTLVEAAHRAGRHRQALALASERTSFKPSSPFNWTLAARSARDLKDREAAEQISVRAQRRAQESARTALKQLAAVAA